MKAWYASTQSCSALPQPQQWTVGLIGARNLLAHFLVFVFNEVCQNCKFNAFLFLLFLESTTEIKSLQAQQRPHISTIYKSFDLLFVFSHPRDGT